MAKTTSKEPADSWANVLRAAITADGRTRYAICQATKRNDVEPVQQSVLARFMAGASINLTTAERLGRAVGIEFTERHKAKTHKR